MVKKQEKEYYTVRISAETHEELKRLGEKGDTFDDIIRRLLSKK